MVKSFDLRGANARHTLRPPVPFDSANANTGGSGAQAQVVLPASASSPNVVHQVFASYSAAPPAGSTLIILDGASEVFRAQVATAGLTLFSFDPPLANAVANTTLTVTLAAPGTTILASVYVNALQLK